MEFLRPTGGLIQWTLPPTRVPDSTRVPRSRRRPPVPLLIMTALVVLIGAAHDAFLAAVLPTVLPGFGVTPDRSVETAGFLLFLSGPRPRSVDWRPHIS
jgi:hypothetical protein